MADVSDAFGRTVVDGWGSADVGGAWSTVGTAADYDVDSGVGKHTVGVVNVSYRTHIGSYKNARIRAKCRPMFDPSGGSIWMSLLARYADASNHYIFRLRIQPTNADPAQVMIQKQVGGVLSTVVAEANITGDPPSGTGSEWWWIEAEMDESALRMKAWRDADPEPGSYQLTGTDGDLTAAGGVGARTLASSSMSNTLPVVVEWDEFTAWEISKPKPSVLSATGSVPTPSIKVSSKALPLVLAPTVTTPAPTIINNPSVDAETVVAIMETYDATGSKAEFAEPAAVAATGTVQSPTPSASSNATPGAISSSGIPSDAAGSISADAAMPETVEATGSVTAPTLRVSEFATPTVVSASSTITTPDIGLTQKVTTTTVTAIGSVPTPTGRTADNATPATVTASGIPTGALGSSSEHADPTTLAATGTAYDADGSESSKVVTVVVAATGTVYGTGIVRTSSIAMPDTLVAIGFSFTAQPITGDPIEWEGPEQVRFTQISAPTPYIVGEDGIQYGRVRITRA